MKDELFIKINGEYEQLDLNENIQLKYESNLFKPFDEFSNSSSYTISLPRTARNRRLLGACDMENTLNDVPYVKQVARVQRDGVILINDADMAVMRVTEDAIELNLFWGAATINDDDYTLQDLQDCLDAAAVTFEREAGYFAYPYWCKVNNGQDDDAKILPTYPCYALLLACCKKLGMKIYSDDGISEGFPDAERMRFDGLVMPFLNAEDVGETINPTTATLAMQSGVRFPPYFVFDNISDTIERASTFHDADDSEHWIGILPTQKYLCIKLSGSLDVSIPIACSANLDNLSVGISIFESEKSTISGSNYKAYLRLKKWIKEYLFTDSTLSDGYRIFHFNFDADDNFTQPMSELTSGTSQNGMYVIELSTCKGHSQNKKLFPVFKDVTIDVSAMKIEVAYDHVTPNVGQKFYFAPNFPDMDCVDYITAMCAVTGIAMVPIQGKFYPRAYSRMIERASSKNPTTTTIIEREDVTTEITEISFHDDDYARTNYFRYSDNEDRDWDASLPCNDWTLEKETDLVSLPFNTYKTVDGVAYAELYTYDDDGDETFNDLSDQPIFCQTANEVVDGKKQYYCTTGRQWKNILSDYYEEYAAIINPFRVYKMKAKFGAERLAMLDMSKPLFVRKYGLFFFIRSITTGDDNECEFELIKIRFTDEEN